MKKTVLTSLCVALLTGTGAMAMGPTYELSPVVVTASRVEEKAFDAPANVSVVTAKEIKARHYNHLGDVLRDIPGMNVQSYGSTGEAYSANRMYVHGNGYVVFMVDGMRLNMDGDKKAAFEFPHMDTIERVEVLKGAGSTLYGADAAGGVVNIITKKETHGVHSSLDLASGSFGLRQIGFNSRGAKDHFFYRISAANRKIGNYTDAHSQYVRQDISAKTYDVTLGHRFDKESSVSLSYSKYLSDYIRPSQGGYIGTTYAEDKKEWDGKISHKKGDLVSTDVKGDKDDERLSLHWNQKLDDRFSNQFIVFQNRNAYLDGMRATDFKVHGAFNQLTYRGDNHVLIAGIDYYKETGNLADKNTKDMRITNKAFFLQDEFTFAPHWTLTPGVRYTKNSVSGSKTTKNVTLGYNNGQVNVYGSYKEYFILPSQFQLFDATYGNRDLKPMTGYGLEGGLKYQLPNDLLFTASIFRAKTKDIIVYKSLPPTPEKKYNGTYENKAEETSNGFTVGAEKILNNHFRIRANYTYTDIPAESQYKNKNRDGYIPEHQVNLDLDYTRGPVQGILTARGLFNRPGRKAEEKNVPDSMKSFWVVDATLNYQASENVSAYVKVNNLFDKFYTDMLYIANPNITDPTKPLNEDNWYPAPGRNFQFGVEFKF